MADLKDRHNRVRCAQHCANWIAFATTLAMLLSHRAVFANDIMRGDWETPHTIALSYDPNNPGLLRTLLAHMAPYQHIALLVGAEHQIPPLDDARITLIASHHGTPWIRDYAPIQIRTAHGEALWLDTEYSRARAGDDAVPQELARALHHDDVRKLSRNLEGGAIASNGNGLCIMTQRNLQSFCDPQECATLLSEIGCMRTLVMSALVGESTGHADMLVHFFSARNVGVSRLDEHSDNAASLNRIAARLRHLGFNVVRVPMPRGAGSTYYSFVNVFHLEADKILVPRYEGIPARVARASYAALRRLVPRHTQLLGIDSEMWVRAGGSVHCVTSGLFTSAKSPPQQTSQYATLRPTCGVRNPSHSPALKPPSVDRNACHAR